MINDVAEWALDSDDLHIKEACVGNLVAKLVRGVTPRRREPEPGIV